jgi:hypothetical protein
MDPYLAKEVWRRIPEPDRGLWSVITSGQLATADRAARCGILSSDECCFCGAQPQTWRHLLYDCEHMEPCRADFRDVPGEGVLARDLRVVCRKVLRSPEVLPQVTALYGIPVEMGADYTGHWWYAEAVGDGAAWRSVEAGALPTQAYPDLENIPQLRCMTARQYVEHTLGPTPAFELGVRPRLLALHLRPDWAPQHVY